MNQDPSHPPARRQISPREQLILALDFPSATQAFALLDDLRRRSEQPPLWVKVGLELFIGEGPKIVHALRDRGYLVFLDLKLHDIPNTVASAIRAVGALDVSMLTVHAAGGPAMLKAAAEAAAALSKPPRLLAVTVLTSMDARQLSAIGVANAPVEQVVRLGRAAWHAGIHGLVASPLEAATLSAELGPSLHLVTPGIRSSTDSSVDDQQRFATATAALRAGATQLVVGRPIARAQDPAAAFDALLNEVNGCEATLAMQAAIPVAR